MGGVLSQTQSAKCGYRPTFGVRERSESDGPFFQYLEDRHQKGLTAVLMRHLAGFGDEPDNPHGHSNEGGYAFSVNEKSRLNEAYFAALDRRIRAVTDRGLVPITMPAWWGKTDDKRCPIEFDWALRLSEDLAVRYGADIGIWSLSGEYQYAFRDCGWDTAHFDKMGAAVRALDPYHHPISIHPSSGAGWAPPHNRQSSRAFNASSWLDHHWLQTGQSADRMHAIVRAADEPSACGPRGAIVKSRVLSGSLSGILHDTVFEDLSFDDEGDLVVAAEPSPPLGGGLGELEHHRQAGPTGSAPLGFAVPEADGGEGRLDWVGCPQVLPMFCGEGVERQ